MGRRSYFTTYDVEASTARESSLGKLLPRNKSLQSTPPPISQAITTVCLPCLTNHTTPQAHKRPKNALAVADFLMGNEVSISCLAASRITSLGEMLISALGYQCHFCQRIRKAALHSSSPAQTVIPNSFRLCRLPAFARFASPDKAKYDHNTASKLIPTLQETWIAASRLLGQEPRLSFKISEQRKKELEMVYKPIERAVWDSRRHQLLHIIPIQDADFKGCPSPEWPSSTIMAQQGSETLGDEEILENEDPW
ncbi:hypothetical protein CPC08DRAFT_756331 [Agrocybe pediades]|nr:hypothetical protein CPC08DRAFT_756331 [Agrocybe pediades]